MSLVVPINHPCLPCCTLQTYGTVKESESDQLLRNKALIIDEIESTLTAAVVDDLNNRCGFGASRQPTLEGGSPAARQPADGQTVSTPRHDRHL